MTVESTKNKSGPFNATGAGGTFPRDFLILDEDHLRVIRVRGEIETDLTAGVSHTGIGEASGTVVVSSGLRAGDQVYLLRSVPNLQRSDYNAQGRVRTDQVETDLDLLEMQIQDHGEVLDRALVVPVSEEMPGEEAMREFLLAAERSAAAGAAAIRANNAADLAEAAAGMVVRDPYIILVLGQSQARGNAGSTGGDYSTPEGVFFWDNDMSGNSSASFVEGTAWRQAAFGTPPLNIWNGGQSLYANNLALAAARKAWKQGFAVYVIQIAIGGTPAETFITDAGLSANGWTRTGGEDMTPFMYPGIRTAIDAVPGRAGSAADALFWVHGGDNAFELPETHASKVKVVFDELETAGLIDQQQTPIVSSQLATYGERTTKIKRHAAAMYSLQYRCPTLRVVETVGMATHDGIHATGRAMGEWGARYFDATMTPPVYQNLLGRPLPMEANPDTGFLDFTYAPAIDNARAAPWNPVSTVSDVMDAYEDSILGWCFRRAAGSQGVVVCRYKWDKPTRAKAVIEVAARSSGTSAIGWRIYEFGADGELLDPPFIGQWFENNGAYPFNGSARSFSVEINPSGSSGPTFRNETRYWTFGLVYGTGTGDDIRFNLRRFDIEQVTTGGAWVNVLGSRSPNAAYTNTNDHEVEVALSGVPTAQQFVQVSEDGSSWISVGRLSAGTGDTCTFTVPIGHQYRINGPVETLNFWAERRR
ncbi:sialate O-acetylesterase [Paracoccus homiensis]|uniref:Sialate O-acetylesterase domain-containing protein n=1 Tax=Paracoccus homiensis TaxID=364199 RepID=A0A1I0GTW3_9RHOB|nr:sialate O-acetylesterase [Paracoccus homiensis]SET74811.1 hypothetical protein SAMN04489858_10987 [Paracoccus homiensis]